MSSQAHAASGDYWVALEKQAHRNGPRSAAPRLAPVASREVSMRRAFVSFAAFVLAILPVGASAAALTLILRLPAITISTA